MVGHAHDVTPFGDIATIARGQLYFVNENFRFAIDPDTYDCEICETPPSCEYCQLIKSGIVKLIALWNVRRVRYKTSNNNYYYELEYVVSPIEGDVGTDYVIRNGIFDYNIPGHVFVVRSDGETNESNVQNLNRIRLKNLEAAHTKQNEQWNFKADTKSDIQINVERQYLPAKPIVHEDRRYLPPYDSVTTNRYPIEQVFTQIKHDTTPYPYTSQDHRDITTKSNLQKEIEIYNKLFQILTQKTTTPTVDTQKVDKNNKTSVTSTILEESTTTLKITEPVYTTSVVSINKITQLDDIFGNELVTTKSVSSLRPTISTSKMTRTKPSTPKTSPFTTISVEKSTPTSQTRTRTTHVQSTSVAISETPPSTTHKVMTSKARKPLVNKVTFKTQKPSVKPTFKTRKPATIISVTTTRGTTSILNTKVTEFSNVTKYTTSKKPKSITKKYPTRKYTTSKKYASMSKTTEKQSGAFTTTPRITVESKETTTEEENNVTIIVEQKTQIGEVTTITSKEIPGSKGVTIGRDKEIELNAQTTTKFDDLEEIHSTIKPEEMTIPYINNTSVDTEKTTIITEVNAGIKLPEYVGTTTTNESEIETLIPTTPFVGVDITNEIPMVLSSTEETMKKQVTQNINYVFEDIFGELPPSQKEITMETTVRPKETKEIDEIFGDLPKNSGNKINKQLEYEEATPKIIFTNFYKPSTLSNRENVNTDFPLTTSYDNLGSEDYIDEITQLRYMTESSIVEPMDVEDDAESNKPSSTSEIVPLTSQSYSTSISFEVNKKMNESRSDKSENVYIEDEKSDLKTNNLNVYMNNVKEQLKGIINGSSETTEYSNGALTLVNQTDSAGYINRKKTNRKLKRKTFISKCKTRKKQNE